MFYVVTYDIPCDRRRSKLHKKLKDYGEPVQYSVFECNLSPKQKLSMTKAIRAHISHKEDRVRIYALCSGCKKSVNIIGKGKITEDCATIFV